MQLRVLRPFRLRAAAAAALVAIGTVACGTPDATTEPSIVVAAWPLEDAARRLLGDLAPVVSLATPGVEPHDLELDASDLEVIAGARAVIVIPGGFQPALERAAAASTAPTIEVSLDGEEDPHLWLDPIAWGRAIERLAADLATLVPAGANDITSRAADIVTALEDLDARWVEGVRQCARETVVVLHDAFARWSRYGLTLEALSGITPGDEPGAGRLAELETLIGSTGTTTLFVEPEVSPQGVEVLAASTGAQIAVLDPLERALDGDYVTRMDANLTALREALDCG